MKNTDNETVGFPKSENPEFVIDYAGVLELLPHRFPFLYVDGVIAYEKGVSITGQKNFSLNENFFNGHFPAEPVVPGVIQIEALAQISCILVALSLDDIKGKRPAFTGIEAARFRKPVRPGDVLVLKSELQKMRRGIAVLTTRAEVRGELAAEAVIKAAMV
jgi:beta-hydroxyacyl-ACP dehydratase FabZ